MPLAVFIIVPGRAASCAHDHRIAIQRVATLGFGRYSNGFSASADQSSEEGFAAVRFDICAGDGNGNGNCQSRVFYIHRSTEWTATIAVCQLVTFFFLSYLTASVSSVELKNAIQGDADIDRFDAPKSCKKAKLV